MGIDRKVNAEQIERVAGNPFAQCVDMLLPGLRTSYPALLDTLNDCEIEIVRLEGGDFFDGVIDGITHLASKYQIFLVSNCQEWYLNLFLKFSGLRPVLAGCDCHGLSSLSKPEMLARIKSTHGLTNPVYIGDTASDERAAKVANMAFVYVAWGFGKPEGEPKVVNSFTELLRYLSLEEQLLRPSNQALYRAPSAGGSE